MFGVSTYCMRDKPLPYALAKIADVAQHAEIMDDGLHYLDAHEEYLDTFSFRYTVHAPMRTVNIASHLEPIRKACVEVTRRCIEISSSLGANCVVVHPGYAAWKEERDVGIFQLQKSVIELKKISEEYSMPLCFENMPDDGYYLMTKAEDRKFFDGFPITLDIGHANISGSLDEFLQGSIRHMHVHDNDGKKDMHLAVGDGTIDFAPIYERIKELRGSLVPVIEVDNFDAVLKTITQFKRNGIEQ